MKITFAVLLAIVVGILAWAACALCGAGGGALLALLFYMFAFGQKEPMPAMLLGGVLGALLGAGGGLILGVYLGVRTYAIFIKPQPENPP